MEDRREFLLKSMGSGLALLRRLELFLRFDFFWPWRSGQNSATSSRSMADVEPYEKLAQVASDCIRTGLACVNHCQKELAAGKTTMAKCNAATHDMVAISRSHAGASELEISTGDEIDVAFFRGV